jgi:metal-responsive CopG/Arc/MetJ family transcriptional regulator
MWYIKFITSYAINERMKDMPTKKPIISIVLDEETLEKVEDFQYNNRIPSRSKALNEIIKLGIEQIKKQNEEGE